MEEPFPPPATDNTLDDAEMPSSGPDRSPGAAQIAQTPRRPDAQTR